MVLLYPSRAKPDNLPRIEKWPEVTDVGIFIVDLKSISGSIGQNTQKRADKNVEPGWYLHYG